MNLPAPVLTAISKLEASGFEAYAVGGCVRDSILDTEPLDWDITTSALPEEVSEIFRDFQVIPTGIKHGTVTVIISSMHLEITTYRIDGKYEDNRHPVQVTFSRNIAEDLSRRDFTINAMAYNPQTGFFDPFRGLDDLNRKIIKAVGIPEKRFSEDALRIMRALRFAAVLGFEIEEKTADAVFQCRTLLKNIAAERIGTELNKILLSPAPDLIFEKYFSVFSERLFGIPNFPDKQKIDFSPLSRTISDLAPRLAVFIICFAKALNSSPVDFSERFFSNMRYDNQTHRETANIIKNLDIVFSDNRIFLRHIIKEKGLTTVRNLINVQKAFNKSDFCSTEITLEKIISEQDCCNLRNLAVNGTDLTNGFSLQGEEIGKVLVLLLDAVIENKCENKKDALLEYFKNKLLH